MDNIADMETPLHTLSKKELCFLLKKGTSVALWVLRIAEKGADMITRLAGMSDRKRHIEIERNVPTFTFSDKTPKCLLMADYST